MTAMRSSVSLLYSFCLNVQPFAAVKSSGSQVAAVYLIWVNSFPLPNYQLILDRSKKQSCIPVNHFSSTADEIGVGTGYLSSACAFKVDSLADKVPFSGKLYASRRSSSLWDRLTSDELGLG